MNEPHRIRLRGAWEVTTLKSPHPPRDDSCSRHTRRFGKPTNLDPREQVWLVIEPCQGDLTIELNGKAIGSAANGAAFEFDITTLLAPRNELRIDVSGTGDQSRLTGEVRLEIRFE